MKGFAIFLVVFGHVLQGKIFPVAVPLHELIYTFHMPLFMFLSGLFAYKVENATGKLTFLKKKVLLLIVPCLVWSILMCIYKKENFLNDVVLRGGYHYWFLFLLFLFFAIIVVISMVKIDRRVKPFIYLLPWLTIYFLDSDSIMSGILNKNRFLYNYPFFVIAFYLGKNKGIINILSNWKLGISCLAAYLIGYKFLLTSLSSFGGGILAIFAIIGLLFLFKNIKWLGENMILKKWGNVTLEIYLVHYFFTGLIPNDLASIMGASLLSISSMQCIFVCIVCSVAIIQLCIYFSIVISEKKFLHKILFGR